MTKDRLLQKAEVRNVRRNRTLRYLIVVLGNGWDIAIHKYAKTVNYSGIKRNLWSILIQECCRRWPAGSGRCFRAQKVCSVEVTSCDLWYFSQYWSLLGTIMLCTTVLSAKCDHCSITIWGFLWEPTEMRVLYQSLRTGIIKKMVWWGRFP